MYFNLKTHVVLQIMDTAPSAAAGEFPSITCSGFYCQAALSASTYTHGIYVDLLKSGTSRKPPDIKKEKRTGIKTVINAQY